MTFDANAIFEAELTKRGVSFQKEDESVYRVEVDGWIVSASLENVRRNAEREQDEGVVTRFVDHVLGFSGGHPPWDDAQTLLFWSAEPTTADVGDSIHVGVTDEVARVLTLTNEEQSKVTWVTPDMCERWAVTIADACAAATINQDRLLDGLELDAASGSDRLDTLGMIPVHPPYKASTIFAASFKKFVEPVLGWPVLVVLPCRDFVYVIAEQSPLLNNLGTVVVNEFKSSGYPITTEVLRVSDEGIEAIGHFPA
jgi:hypothetical protein